MSQYFSMQGLETQINRWRDDSVPLLPPEHPDAVQRVFANLGARATPDVLYLYGHLDGMECWDDELWQLWSLAEIAKEKSQSAQRGIVFADFCNHAWCYRLRPIDADVSAVFVDFYDGNEPTLISPSLTDFFDAYARDAGELLQRKELPTKRRIWSWWWT